MNDIQKSYLEKNIIVIKGDINGITVLYIEEALSMLYVKKSPDIFILISSAGGSVEAGLDIVDLLSLYPGKKTAIVTKEARSMAAVIIQVCDERRATPHSTIMIHHIRRRITLDVLRDKKKRSAFLNEMEKTQEKIYKILAQKTKKQIKDISGECKKERNMTVNEAIEFGLIDMIQTASLPK